MQIIIAASGDGRCVYDETIDIVCLGDVNIKRGSYVEPNEEGRWTADLSPVDGPVLGPFDIRSEALRSEIEWLHAHWLNPSTG